MICLRTGDAGKDATAREDDPGLIGQIYAVPYQVLEPDLAFVVDGPEGVAGYLFGALDTTCLRRAPGHRLVSGSAAARRRSGTGPRRAGGAATGRATPSTIPTSVPGRARRLSLARPYRPVARARGRGIGRRCMAFLERQLAAAGSTGLVLDVDPRNTRRNASTPRSDIERVSTPHSAETVYMAKRLVA